jgi:type III restriction enzyme
MKTSLFDFQEVAKQDLFIKINEAKMLSSISNPQVISFSAPTGSGKTIIMTSLFEDIFYGAEDFEGQPDSIFVWLSDMPELNEQTRMKIESKSDRIRVRQLVTIDSIFDAEHLEGGTIYFLNTQKLGNEKLLTQKSDARQYTIWETLTNTAQRFERKLYVVIDEAHRGMYTSTRAENTAQSIMQKFLLGSETDRLCQMPLVIGVTATPQRFQQLLSETSSTVHKVTVKPEDVIASGLLKDRVIIHYPEMAINAEMTMFNNALSHWKEMTMRWKEHCEKESEPLVMPILVVQVDDGTDSIITKTDMETCMDMLEQSIGRTLQEGEVVHTFNDENTLLLSGIQIPRVDVSHIEEDNNILVVFFKMNLSTGWDCPRAEVMMSFRHAQDYTYISQLLGRMVRTPLAHRIEADAALNAVHLFLPYYDKNTVESVITALKESDDAIPTETGTSKELVTLYRNPSMSDVFNNTNVLITYRVNSIRKQSSLKRLCSLSRALAQDGISRNALRDVRDCLVEQMSNVIQRLKDIGNYKERVATVTGLNLQTLAFDFGDKTIIRDEDQNIAVSSVDINSLFRRSKKVLGDDIGMHYWTTNVINKTCEETEAKIHVIIFASDPVAMNNLEAFADTLFSQIYEEFKRAISQLESTRRADYEKLILASGSPVHIDWRAPFSIDFKRTSVSRRYDKHLYLDENGEFYGDLGTWEHEIIEEELSNSCVVAWLRNLDRKQWSIEIPYEVAGVEKPMFPDLMIVRKDKYGYIFDLLEPHDSSRSDNYPKAKGLAKFAEKHDAIFGRIQLIRKQRGADGVERYYRLDLSNNAVMRKVRAINSNEELDRIFDNDAII